MQIMPATILVLRVSLHWSGNSTRTALVCWIRSKALRKAEKYREIYRESKSSSPWKAIPTMVKAYMAIGKLSLKPAATLIL